ERAEWLEGGSPRGRLAAPSGDLYAFADVVAAGPPVRAAALHAERPPPRSEPAALADAAGRALSGRDQSRPGRLRSRDARRAARRRDPLDPRGPRDVHAVRRSPG